MPLTLYQRPGSHHWWVRGTVCGQSVRESTRTGDRALAEGYRIKRESELWQGATHGTRSIATFATAVESYLSAEERSPATKDYVRKLLLHFQTTPLRRIDQEAIDRAYRAVLTPNAGPATKLRAVLTPMRAILTHAANRRWCDLPAFETPRVPRAITPFLLPAQVTALIREGAPHLRPLLVFLFGTGARLSEALELRWERVDLAAARGVLWQKQRTERHVDLAPCVVAALSALPYRDGHVFRPARHGAKIWAPEGYRSTGRTSGGQIKTAWATACQRAGLPGQTREWVRPGGGTPYRRFAPDHTPHSARHTWASWRYCQHRDLLRLRDEGGWESTSQVERYAKLMPAHYAPEIDAWFAGAITEATVRTA